MNEPSSLDESDEVKVRAVVFLPEKGLAGRGSRGVGGGEKGRGGEEFSSICWRDLWRRRGRER